MSPCKSEDMEKIWMKYTFMKLVQAMRWQM